MILKGVGLAQNSDLILVSRLALNIINEFGQATRHISLRKKSIAFWLWDGIRVIIVIRVIKSRGQKSQGFTRMFGFRCIISLKS